MAAFNSQWSFEGLAQPSVADIFGQLTMQLAELERQIDTRGHQAIQIDHYQPQSSYTPACYHPDWQDHLNHSWNNIDQDQFYAPSITYPSEFMYEQPPPQQEDTSRFAMLLGKFIEQTEIRNNNVEASIQKLTSQVQQLANIVNDWPQATSHNDTDINPTEEGEEQYKADTLEYGTEFAEHVRRNRKRSHSDGEEDCNVAQKMSKIEAKEKKDEDDHAMDYNGIKQISPMSGSQQFNSTEYVQVDLGESTMKIMDEFKFRGKLQSLIHARHIKEKTKRRHDKTIFAIEPD